MPLLPVSIHFSLNSLNLQIFSHSRTFGRSFINKYGPGNKFFRLFLGGLWNAVEDSAAIEARAFGMFLKSQRQWKSKPLEDRDAERFRQAMQVTSERNCVFCGEGFFFWGQVHVIY